MNSKILLSFYWMACFLATHVPGPEVPHVEIPYLDKAIHLGMFIGLGFLLNRAAFARSAPKIRFRKTLVILAIYAAFDEVSQTFFQRDAELTDWAADVVGASLGYLAWYFKRPV